MSSCKIPDEITVDDCTLYLPSEIIDLLIGANHFWNIVLSVKIILGSNKFITKHEIRMNCVPEKMIMLMGE